jgi:hypothetical protein
LSTAEPLVLSAISSVDGVVVDITFVAKNVAMSLMALPAVYENANAQPPP